MSCIDRIVSEVQQRSFSVTRISPDCLPVLYEDSDWTEFSRSWGRLLPDDYMGDNGEYRQRRYQVYEWLVENNQFELNPDQRHYQSRRYNALNGGVFREFEPFEPFIQANKAFLGLRELASGIAHQLKPSVAQWHIEAHQFRIIGSTSVAGHPVPEGMHKDGVDYVFVFFIDRQSVRGGVSKVYDENKQLIASCQLSLPRELMVIDDQHVWHHVTPIFPSTDTASAHRDVVVLTFKSV